MDESLKKQSLNKDRQIADNFIYEHIKPESNTYNTMSKKGILFIEDSKSGYEFICQYIKECYYDIDITVVSICGSGNYKYTYAFNIDTTYDYAIFMYDRGKTSINGKDNRKDLKKGVNRFCRLRPNSDNTKLFYFSPIAFESIPLSFEFLLSEFLAKYDIKDLNSINIHMELVKFLKNDTQLSVDYCIETGKSLERCVEQSIENITDGTNYQIKHIPSSISTCWWKDCSYCNDKNNNCNSIDYTQYNIFRNSKLELISRYSVLGGLSIILDRVYGLMYRNYQPAITGNNKEKIWGSI